MHVSGGCPVATSFMDHTSYVYLSQYISKKKWLSATRYVNLGGFHLVAKIIRELKSHMITYKFKCSHWLKLQNSDWRANFVKDFFLQMNFPPMGALEFIRDHMLLSSGIIKSSN